MMQTVVLTGASRGIGHATAKLFSQNGWRVITCARTEVPDLCPFTQKNQDHFIIDFSSPDAVNSGLERLRSLLKDEPLHALVNNAGISPKFEDGSRLDTFTTEGSVWEEVLQVNLLAPAAFTRTLATSLKNGKGAVVNVTSIAGTRVHKFAGPAYAASKAALSALTREQASDLGKFGVRVNSVSPGEISTGMLSPSTEAEMLEVIPMRRIGTVEEVAATILFLCSGSASYINGTEIAINGGQHV
jgi:NAD(P)-dependent dehydrogenase (short-subunit alcohol dehydrogenase family)